MDAIFMSKAGSANMDAKRTAYEPYSVFRDGIIVLDLLFL